MMQLHQTKMALHFGFLLLMSMVSGCYEDDHGGYIPQNWECVDYCDAVESCARDATPDSVQDQEEICETVAITSPVEGTSPTDGTAPTSPTDTTSPADSTYEVTYVTQCKFVEPEPDENNTDCIYDCYEPDPYESYFDDVEDECEMQCDGRINARKTDNLPIECRESVEIYYECLDSYVCKPLVGRDECHAYSLEAVDHCETAGEDDASDFLNWGQQ